MTRPTKFIATLLGSLWLLFVLLDYYLHHRYYGYAIKNFAYPHLLIVLFLFSTTSLYCLSAERRFFGTSMPRVCGLSLWGLTFIGLLIQGAISGYATGLLSVNAFGRLCHFLTEHGSLHVFSFLLVTLGFVIGHRVLSCWKEEISYLNRALIEIALGLSLLTIYLFVLAFFGVLWRTPILVAVAAIALVYWRSGCSFAWHALCKPLPRPQFTPMSVASCFLISCLLPALLLGSLKPLPIGHDGVTLYANTAHLVAKDGSLVVEGISFYWEILMAGAFVVSESMPQMLFIPVLPGILSLFAVYQIARTQLESDRSLFCIAMLLNVPMITFLITGDEKVDFALLYFALAITLVLLHGDSKQDELSNSTHQNSTWALLGWFLGFSLGIKLSALFVVIACTALCAARALGPFAGYLWCVLSICGYWCVGRLAYLPQVLRREPRLLSASILLLIASTFFSVIVFRKQLFARAFAKNLGILTIVASVAFSPWLFKAYSDYQFTHKLNHISSLGRNLLLPDPSASSSTTTTAPQADGTPVATGSIEELERYAGGFSALPRILMLPYNITMNSAFQDQYYVDIGMLFLLALPLVLLLGSPISPIRIFLMALVVILLVLLWIPGDFWIRGALSADDAKHLLETARTEHTKLFQSLITTPLVNTLTFLTPVFHAVGGSALEMVATIPTFWSTLFAFLLCGCLYYQSCRPNNGLRLTRFGSFTAYYLIVWIFLGNGIAWYGLLLFPLLLIAIHVHYRANISQQFPLIRLPLIAIIATSSLISLVWRFTSATKNDFRQPAFYIFPAVANFSMGIIDSRTVLSQMNPLLPATIELLNSDLESKIYRIGTSLNFFIEKNNVRVYDDSQLDTFTRFSAQVTPAGTFWDILKKHNFRYVLYDLATSVIDRTKEQSLRQKDHRFMSFLYDSQRVRLIYTDNLIVDPQASTESLAPGQVAVRFGLGPNTVSAGTFALFEILN